MDTERLPKRLILWVSVSGALSTIIVTAVSVSHCGGDVALIFSLLPSGASSCIKQEPGFGRRMLLALVFFIKGTLELFWRSGYAQL